MRISISLSPKSHFLRYYCDDDNGGDDDATAAEATYDDAVHHAQHDALGVHHERGLSVYVAYSHAHVQHPRFHK